MFAGVGGADLRADAGLAFGHDGVEETDGVDACFQQAGGELLSQRGVVEHDRGNGVAAGFQIKTGDGHLLAETNCQANPIRVDGVGRIKLRRQCDVR